MNLDLIGAILAGLAGFALGLRQIMLSPAHITFPAAPGVVRASMFVFALALAGMSALYFGHAAKPGLYAGAATWPVLIVLAFLALYNGVLTANVIRQRYSPEVWRRLNRATETVKRSCPPKRLPLFPSPVDVIRARAR